ncbi:hypothetical protein FGIG_12256 [Fasciola gigantica]|uniref:Uncharacterized protein n=1 Tax=Fasciola gigantica TaxID=46835 RepID=A0A504Z2V3_FASGI|nr:hypothetical protein FGIG_12256 [Fasciola gigantica]
MHLPLVGQCGFLFKQPGVFCYSSLAEHSSDFWRS